MVVVHPRKHGPRDFLVDWNYERHQSARQHGWFGLGDRDYSRSLPRD